MEWIYKPTFYSKKPPLVEIFFRKFFPVAEVELLGWFALFPEKDISWYDTEMYIICLYPTFLFLLTLEVH